MIRRKGWVQIFAIYLIIGVLLSGCSTEKQALGKNALNISTTVVTKCRRNIDPVITGRIEAVQAADVASKVAGKVENIYVDVGNVVKKDQVLVNLDASDLAAAVELATATVENAQISLDLAQKNYERGQELFKAEVISQAEFENNYEGTYLKAKAGLRSAEAGLQKVQITYNDTFIKAPFSGIITACNVDVGEMVSMQVPVVSIANLDQILIHGYVTENQINELVVGQEVKVKVLVVTAEPFTGKISNIAPAVNAQTKTYPIKVKIDNPKHLLKPGMYAEVQIQDSWQDKIVIPNQAIISEEDNKRVYVLQNGKAVKRNIELGSSDGQNTTILSGLEENEIIIVKGLDLLEDGQLVQI